jgi:hypothetical protein
METVEPLAALKGLEITTYDPQDTEGLLQGILEKYPGGNVLIVGHSNTVPGMVNTLIWEEKFPNFSESEYNRLFVVSSTGNQKGTYTELDMASFFQP